MHSIPPGVKDLQPWFAPMPQTDSMYGLVNAAQDSATKSLSTQAGASRVTTGGRREPDEANRQALAKESGMTADLRAVSQPSRLADEDEGISAEELQLAARNHGLPLEAMRLDLTPTGLHYLLTHYDM